MGKTLSNIDDDFKNLFPRFAKDIETRWIGPTGINMIFKNGLKAIYDWQTKQLHFLRSDV